MSQAFNRPDKLSSPRMSKSKREPTADREVSSRACSVISLPYTARSADHRFELTQTRDRNICGSYFNASTHNRFEMRVEYVDGRSEWFSVLANLPYLGEQTDLANESCAFKVQLSADFRRCHFEFKNTPDANFSLDADLQLSRSAAAELAPPSSYVLFDVSDLVYYLGHHDNLTGIQRVQACVLMGMMETCAEQPRGYITYNNRTRDFLVIDPQYFESLLRDVSLPVSARRVHFDRMEARVGILPNTQPIATELSSRHKGRLIVYLLGAAWVRYLVEPKRTAASVGMTRFAAFRTLAVLSAGWYVIWAAARGLSYVMSR